MSAGARSRAARGCAHASRRDVLRGGVAALAALALPGCALTRRTAVTRSGPRFDLVIGGGLVVDGTGTAPFAADVGITGGRVAAVGRIDRERARRFLDATGACVAPGFVDLHSHSDRTILEHPQADSRVLQGYTTEVTGNCGGSAAPTSEFAGVGAYLDALDAARPAIHHALLVGHGTLREKRIGEVDRHLAPTELRDVEHDLARALDEGAFGLSSGLEYVPGLYAPPEELRALARIVAHRGRLYASHMRSEDARLVEAVDEILLLARETGARTQVSHLKACGRRNWPKLDVALARIEAAAAAGHDVRADAYPYTAYSTGFTILLEPWVKDGGDDALFARFADPVSRARIRGEIVARVDNEPGDFERIVIASRLSGEHARFTGRSIADVAAALGVEPAEAFLRVLEHERGGVSYVGHAMQESDVARVLAHPLVCVGSDGYVQPVLGASQPHPRSFGTVARVLGRYCRELGAFDLATAVRKLSADPAARAGLADRGRLLSGFHADVVVFDAAGIADRATFEEPRLPPAGIEHVVVAGQPVIEHGRRTGARPGGALRAG